MARKPSRAVFLSKELEDSLKRLDPDHNNPYRYDHPEGFRSCYTLVMCEGLGVCPLIIDLKTHTDYDKVFGYKTT